jgi:hypothetical protein
MIPLARRPSRSAGLLVGPFASVIEECRNRELSPQALGGWEGREEELVDAVDGAATPPKAPCYHDAKSLLGPEVRTRGRSLHGPIHWSY